MAPMNWIQRLFGSRPTDASPQSLLDDARSHAQRTITRALAFGMEAREVEMQIVEHSALVSMVSGELGERMHISEADAYVLKTAAELHEVGMFGISPELLMRSTEYSADELALVRGQAKVSGDLAALMHGPRVGRLIEHQYDDYDAPEEGPEDPDRLLAGILRVADAIAAVTSPRPYQMALSLLERGLMLQRGAGTRFHPLAVESAMGMA
jgi:HD-GYP domain-containing protein (c-di-GMP phosphodiesterase class II)